MHAENGLAGAGRTENEGAGALGRSASHHRVEAGNPQRPALDGCAGNLGRRGEHRLDPGVDAQSLVANLEEMGPAKIIAPAELHHHHLTDRPDAVHHVLELDQAVDHRPRGVGFPFVQGVGEQDAGAADEREQDVQLVDEFLEIGLRGSRALGSGDSVDDQQRRAVPLDGLADESDQPLQPIVPQRLVAADVMDALSDRRRVEEQQVGNMRQHPRVRFGEQRDVQGLAPGRRMAEARLVPEDGLPRSGSSGDDVAAALQEAAVEDGVELRDARGHARQRLRPTLIRLHAALPPNLLRGCSPRAAARP